MSKLNSASQIVSSSIISKSEQFSIENLFTSLREMQEKLRKNYVNQMEEIQSSQARIIGYVQKAKVQISNNILKNKLINTKNKAKIFKKSLKKSIPKPQLQIPIDQQTDLVYPKKDDRQTIQIRNIKHIKKNMRINYLAIVGKIIQIQIKNIRKGPNFQKYFKFVIADQSGCVQALIQNNHLNFKLGNVILMQYCDIDCVDGRRIIRCAPRYMKLLNQVKIEYINTRDNISQMIYIDNNEDL